MRKSFAQAYAKNKKNIDALIRQNTHYNKSGMVMISKDDPWFYEDEWDEYCKELEANEQGNGSAIS